MKKIKRIVALANVVIVISGVFLGCKNTNNLKANTEIGKNIVIENSVNLPTYTFKNNNNKEGLIDNEGNTIIEAKYDLIMPFEGNVAIVSIDGNLGAINRNEEFIVEPTKDLAILPIGNGYFLKGLDLKKLTICDDNGVELITSGEKEFLMYIDTNLFGINNYSKITKLVNRENKVIASFETLEDDCVNVEKVGNGIFALTTKPKNESPFSDKLRIKYYKSNGELLINETFNKSTKFKNGISIVSKNNKYGVIDESGNVIVDFIYEDITDFTDGFAIASNMDSKKIIIDSKGNEILSKKYDNIEENKNGLFIAKEAGKSGVIDSSGEIIVPFEYNSITLNENGNIILDTGETISVIDKDKNTIIPAFKCDNYYLNRNVLMVFKDEGDYFLDLTNNGQPIVDFPLESNFREHIGIIHSARSERYVPRDSEVLETTYKDKKYYINTRTAKVIKKI